MKLLSNICIRFSLLCEYQFYFHGHMSFGVLSIGNCGNKLENEINLIVNIVRWNPQEVYDRIGMETQYEELLGVKVPTNTIPVTPGRNLAVILEVAAMNNRQRKMGYNPALEFIEQNNRHFDELMKERL